MLKNNSHLLQIENLEIAYNEEPVIKNLSFDIQSKSFIGLIGPNGAGKTTLLLSISGQFRPNNGEIKFHKKDIYKQNLEYKKALGYVHEKPFFYPYLTVEDFLRFVAGIKEVSRTEVEKQINELLQTVNLQDDSKKLTSALSQGMGKKLAIAAAMLGPPQIIFLDEALNGVDFESSFQIKNALKEYVTNGGTVILSTHVLEVIEKICDRYIFLKNGKIIADIIAREFQNSGKDLEKYIIELLTSAN